MHPAIALDFEVVAANARAWARLAGGPIRAVLKGNGYGWGFGGLVAALDGVAAAYCVADSEELFRLRARTRLPVIVLGRVRRDELSMVLEADGLPTLGDAGDLEATARWAAARDRQLRVRVGVFSAAGWTGFDLHGFKRFLPALAVAGAQVELWTHFTDMTTIAEDRERFRSAVHAARTAGVRVVATESSSTFPLALSGAGGDAVRVGIGLFGATGGPQVPGVRCALRVSAPVTNVEHIDAGTRIGYGPISIEAGTLVTARCGYADGLPRSLGGEDVLAVGMQYVSLRGAQANAENPQVVLLDLQSSLDGFAQRCGRLAHEIVTAFGNAARANGVPAEV